jgi:hypothetical protein
MARNTLPPQRPPIRALRRDVCSRCAALTSFGLSTQVGSVTRKPTGRRNAGVPWAGDGCGTPAVTPFLPWLLACHGPSGRVRGRRDDGPARKRGATHHDRVSHVAAPRCNSRGLGPRPSYWPSRGLDVLEPRPYRPCSWDVTGLTYGRPRATLSSLRPRLRSGLLERIEKRLIAPGALLD